MGGEHQACLLLTQQHLQHKCITFQAHVHQSILQHMWIFRDSWDKAGSLTQSAASGTEEDEGQAGICTPLTKTTAYNWPSACSLVHTWKQKKRKKDKQCCAYHPQMHTCSIAEGEALQIKKQYRRSITKKETLQKKKDMQGYPYHSERPQLGVGRLQSANSTHVSLQKKKSMQGCAYHSERPQLGVGTLQWAYSSPAWRELHRTDRLCRPWVERSWHSTCPCNNSISQ